MVNVSSRHLKRRKHTRAENGGLAAAEEIATAAVDGCKAREPATDTGRLPSPPLTGPPLPRPRLYQNRRTTPRQPSLCMLLPTTLPSPLASQTEQLGSPLTKPRPHIPRPRIHHQRLPWLDASPPLSRRRVRPSPTVLLPALLRKLTRPRTPQCPFPLSEWLLKRALGGTSALLLPSRRCERCAVPLLWPTPSDPPAYRVRCCRGNGRRAFRLHCPRDSEPSQGDWAHPRSCRG